MATHREINKELDTFGSTELRLEDRTFLDDVEQEVKVSRQLEKDLEAAKRLLAKLGRIAVKLKTAIDVESFKDKKPRTEGFHFVVAKLRGATTLQQIDDAVRWMEDVPYPGTEIPDLAKLVDERRKQLRGEEND